MPFVNIKFAGGEYLQVPQSFTNGMCDVFQDTCTIHADALEFDLHGHLIQRIASVFSDEYKTTRVRATARIATLDTPDLIRVLEISNYFCHDTILDIAARTLANRIPRMSRSELSSVFDIDDDVDTYCIPSQHMLRQVSEFKN